MGRVKIQMKKIEDRQQRNIAFAKRKSGILKKAYELHTLCDVQIALILFSPSGKLFIFYAKTKIEETIYKYVALPCYIRPSLEDELFIRRWIDEMRLDSMHSESNFREKFEDVVRYQVRPKDTKEEVDQCNVQLANVEHQLEFYLKRPNQWESIAEIEYQEKLCQKTLDAVLSRKQYLQGQSKLVDDSSWPSPELETSSVE